MSQKLAKVASNIYAGTGYTRNNEVLVDRVDSYLRSGFVYVPEDIETIQTPEHMIIGKEMHGYFYGDCDDISTLEAAILTALGIDTKFVCIRSKADSSAYDHVYIEAKSEKGWIVSDITVPKGTKHHWYQRLEIAI